MELQPLTPVDRSWLAQFWETSWESSQIVVHEMIFTPDQVEGVVAREGSEIIGVITFFQQAEDCEIVTLNSLVPRKGVGSALLRSVAEEARQRGCRRLFLTTTNDNLAALAFYQKCGFRLLALHPGAVDQSRKVKPQIPLIGENNIPIHDELELDFDLCQRFDFESQGEDIG